ncbi:hypothetical protein [Chryseobacterium lathyri]|jgi:hypothetical protein|uniref:Polymerase nucleotidyl transferase domain-containing protein n=1 Tax=Chryseobacterium lathyri TaxID=395933 RepID=A0A511YES9_9FLAO|nr:hypothetical protein [Chryseobacterium lathyri]GEN73676.1 hypothetical protein CLA01_37480 [Chryseobacterium lathyri]
MKNSIIKDVLIFFAEKDVNCIFLTGSVLSEKKFTEKSDIDVVILTSEINTSYTEKILVKKRLYEFIFLSTADLDQVLKNDILSLKGTLYNMIKTGEIIRDRNAYGKSLKEYVNYLHHILYPFMDINEKNRIFIKVNNYLSDLESNIENYLEQNALINDTVSLLIHYLINQSGEFVGNSKNKLNVLNKLYPDLYVQLERVVKKAINTSDSRDFVTLVKNVLNIKYLDEEYCQKFLGSTIREKEIIIKVEFPLIVINISYHEGNRKFATRFGILSYSIIDNKLELSILVTTSHKNYKIIQILADDYHINTIDIKNIKIKNDYLTNSLRKDSWKFNISFTKYFIDNHDIFLEDKSIIALVLINSILDKINSNIHRSFLKFLFELWFPTAYDINMLFDFFTLLKYKQNILLKYDFKCIQIHNRYQEKKDNFVKLSDELCNILFHKFQDNTDKGGFSTMSAFYNNFAENINDDFLILEQFLTRIFKMIGLHNDKSFYVYFFLKTQYNEYRQ